MAAPVDVATKLLQEEGHAGCSTLFAKGACPAQVHRACTWTALTADDKPVDTGEVECEGAEERFAGEEANGCHPQQPPLGLRLG